MFALRYREGPGEAWASRGAVVIHSPRRRRAVFVSGEEETMSKSTLLLIDGMAVVYRAFYAIQGLSTNDGRPTNALYGFIRMVDQLRDVWKPTHWAVVFDGGLPEERTTLLESYKAQREEMPDPLSQQLESIDEYIECAKIPWLFVEGQEADDVMATMAKWAKRDGATVLVATSDKDLFQIVDESVSIVPPSKKGSQMGPEDVCEKTGVRPERMIEWQALVGDSVDNIPGVPGVGPKTAAKWLNSYGSLEEIWKHVGDLKPERFRAILRQHEERIRDNLTLVRLRDDLDLTFEWDDYAVEVPGADELLAFFEEYELHAMAREVGGSAD